MSKKSDWVLAVCTGQIEDRYFTGNVEETIYKKPYTFVSLWIAGNESQALIFGCGFAKVSYPDVYDKDEGFKIAAKRAARDIARQLGKTYSEVEQ